MLPKILYTVHMNQTLLNENKAKLLAERQKLRVMLNRDSVPDSETPGGHVPKFSELGSEEGENASEVEKFANDLSVMEGLEERLKKVDAALKRVEDGTYGKCEMGDEIDEARLRAEPAASTCIKHGK